MANGLLDFLFGGGSSGNGGIINPQDQQQQINPQIAAGSGNPLLAGLLSFGNSGSPIAALANGIGGIATGQRVDPSGVGQNEGLRDFLLRRALAEQQKYTQSPEYLAKIEEQKAAIGQKYEKPMPVGPGVSLYQPGAPGQEGKVVLQNDTGQLSPETVDQLADQVNAGDMTPLQQQGYGPIGTINRQKINQRAAEKRIEMGRSGQEQAGKRLEYGAEGAAARSTAQREVAVQTPAAEFKRMAPIALEKSEALDRTQYPSINAMYNAIQKGVGGTAVVEAHTALTSVGNIYARVISPTGQGTDATRGTAYGLLNEGLAKGQVKSVIELMGREINAAETGVKDVQTERLRNFLQKNGINVPAGPAGRAKSAPAATAPDPLGLR